jgi:putative ABC transport system permease protein
MFVNAVLAAVLFTLLFLTGNTMMQSVRDRIPELGVLKAMGFGVHAIVGLVVAESLLLCLVAAALGLGLAAMLFPYVFGGLGIPLTVSPVEVIGAGIAIAVVLGVLVSLLPARRAMRSSIVDALAGR